MDTRIGVSFCTEAMNTVPDKNLMNCDEMWLCYLVYMIILQVGKSIKSVSDMM